MDTRCILFNQVVDHGYQIVEDHDIDPCGTPHVDHRVCDGKMMSQNRDIMKRMREIHERRNNMIPTFKLASDETLETMLDGVTQMHDAGLLGKILTGFENKILAYLRNSYKKIQEILIKNYSLKFYNC